MERAKGFEPAHESKQVVEGEAADLPQAIMGSRIGSHITDSDRRDLARVVASWSTLHPAVRAAIVAIVSSSES